MICSTEVLSSVFLFTLKYLLEMINKPVSNVFAKNSQCFVLFTLFLTLTLCFTQLCRDCVCNNKTKLLNIKGVARHMIRLIPIFSYPSILIRLSRLSV